MSTPAPVLTPTEAVALYERLGPLAKFSWHQQQKFALAAATNTVLVLGGSQSGKTSVSAGIVSRLVRREGPIYRRLRNPEGRPLKIWVSPQSFEKYKSNWESRLRDVVFDGMKITHGMELHYTQTPTPVFRWQDKEGGGELYGKAQEQGFLAFESDVCDLIVFDEEPRDRRLYTSAQQRLATTNGIIVLAFTPLLGMSSWTYGSFYRPAVRPEYQVADRVWRHGNAITVVAMGMQDNPEAVAGGGVARLMADPSITEAERATRLHGHYGFVEGLIFPQFTDLQADNADSPYLLDGLPEGRPYSWVLTCDPNKRHGGLLVAIDHEGNRYCVAEHYADGLPDRLHAAAYRDMLGRHGVPESTCAVYADPGGAGAQAIINLGDCGLYAQPVKKDAGSVKASIELIRRAAWLDPQHTHPVTGRKGPPHLYFLRGLRSTWNQDGADYHESRLMWELRQYRQKENAPPDTPVKEHDDVVDTLRYSFLARPFSPVYRDTTIEDERKRLDALSRKASEEFDELVKRSQKPKAASVW
jgi:phage terminase large subunit-like protein